MRFSVILATALAAVVLGGPAAPASSSDECVRTVAGVDLQTVTIPQLQKAMAGGTLTAEQLVEAWQPHGLVLLHGVERPLGRPVEGEDAPGGNVAHLDHHVTDSEHRLVELAPGQPELVAVPRQPRQSGIVEASCEVE